MESLILSIYNEKKGLVRSMVSTIKMVLMAVCPLVCVACMAVPCRMIQRRSSKIETGLLGALGYGILGYIWQYVLYMFGGLYFARMVLAMITAETKNAELIAFGISLFMTVISTVLVAAGLYWGIYLTNQKQLSIYRSAAVGIGFALGKLGIELIYPYLQSLYFSFQINAGGYQGKSEIKQSILTTTGGNMIFGTCQGLLMSFVLISLALIMGKYYLEKNKKAAWLSVLCIYELIAVLNLAVRYAFAKIPAASGAAVFILLIVFAAAAGLVLYYWFKTDEVEVNPLVVFRKISGKGE